MIDPPRSDLLPFIKYWYEMIPFNACHAGPSIVSRILFDAPQHHQQTPNPRVSRISNAPQKQHFTDPVAVQRPTSAGFFIWQIWTAKALAFGGSLIRDLEERQVALLVGSNSQPQKLPP